MNNDERRELILYHANIVVLYITHPPGDTTQKHQREADRNNIVASINRMYELSMQLQP